MIVLCGYLLLIDEVPCCPLFRVNFELSECKNSIYSVVIELQNVLL